MRENRHTAPPCGLNDAVHCEVSGTTGAGEYTEPQPHIAHVDLEASTLIEVDTDELLRFIDSSPVFGGDLETSRPRHVLKVSDQHRIELEHLRRQAYVLEEQLDKLKRLRRHPNEKTTKDEREVIAAWQRVAMHQMRAKVKAEAENVRLKGSLRVQLRRAHGLERLLRKRYSDDFERTESNQKRICVDTQTHETSFERLFQHLDAIDHRRTSTFVENGLATMKVRESRTHMWTKETSSGIAIVFVDVYPFNFESTSSAVWTCCVERRTGEYSSFLRSSFDRLKAKFSIPLLLRRQSVLLNGLAAVKRTRERPYCDVHSFCSEVTVAAHGKYDGIVLRNHGWNVLEKLCDGATIMRCCLLIEKVEQPHKRNAIGLLKDTLIAEYEINHQRQVEAVESYLLDQARQSCPVVTEDV